MEGRASTRKWIWLIVGGVVLVLAAVGIAMLVRSQGSTGGSPSAGAPGVASGGSGSSAGVTGTVGVPMAEAATQTADGTWVTVPKSGAAPVKLDGTFYVRVFWWNDTQARPPRGFRVRWGTSGSWSPNAARSSEIGTIGPFPVGKRIEIFIEPDGTSGEGWAVPVEIAGTMTPGSDQDGVHIEVRDDSVRVLGNPVANFERDYPRP